ncbi:MAG: NAD(P)/FAD-dependent oxidoreductase [Candidatus Zixiibacteriota bacterium]|nr:MAG: NAD(P)/FAD-dependent oxidoreductase [candidate division Zixibacteria bacterium]
MADEQIVIVGGGPAGIAAALELQRQGYDPVIYEKERLGGLLVNANRVDNYPGFPQGIDGLALAENFRQQLEQRNIRVVHSKVKRLDHASGTFGVETPDGTISASYVVVASGTEPDTIENIVSSESGNERVHHEVYPIRDVEGKKVVIIGAGDAAFDYALTLSQKNDVIILNRKNEVRCAPHLWEKASASESISYYENVNVVPPCEEKGAKVIVKCKGPCDDFSFTADYILIAIGRRAQLDFLTERTAKDIGTLEDSGRLFLVGDVKNGDFRQTGIAVGEGIMAAMNIARRLRETK